MTDQFPALLARLPAGLDPDALARDRTGFLPAGHVPAVDRMRRQIELAFKRLKSLLHIDDIRTRTRAGTQ